MEIPFARTGVKFASVAGNHETDADLNRHQILELDMTLNNSATQGVNMQFENPFTYMIPIYDKNGSNISARLWVVDSGRDNCLQMGGWGCILPE